MNFIKDFIMNHPIISLILVVSVANRVEDQVMMNRAMKNGMNYEGYRWRIGPKKEAEATVMENKEEN